MVWVCVPSHNTPLQLTLLLFVLRVLGLSLNTTLSQQFKCFVPPSEAPSEAINSEALLLTPVTQKSLSSKLDDHLFKVLLDMSHITDKAHLLSISSLHAGLLLLQRILVSILTLPNFRLPSNGGWAWTFLMVHAAHCALRLSWTHLAIMLLPAKGVVMWFPVTTN